MAGDTVARVKEKLSIEDVVAPYVKLTRSGKYLKGLSPFNKEKTPSFFVNPERGSYYCFSSSQGGDMFTFVEKMEGVDFKGALKILAEKAGVPLEFSRGTPQDKEKNDRLYEAMARAELFYKKLLTANSSAHAYARSRMLTEATIQTWNLGVAPDAWRELLEELEAAGFSTTELLDAGLVKEAEGKSGTYYDRFRNRLIFPIRDSAGRTVAFTGRALNPEDEAKYLNSPETALYKKSRILFAMDKAKDAIRTRGFAILMEGQMDVLHAHQAEWTNTVALSGTALTPEHLALLKRYSENLMLCLDADRAGLAATQKHALAALAAGMRVKAVELPKDKDPADLISEDAVEFKKRVAEARPVIEFFLLFLSAAEKDQHRLVMQVEKIVIPLLAAIESPIEREHFVSVVARAIASTPEAVRASLQKARRSATAPVAAPAAAEKSVEEAVDDELRLTAIVESYPDTALAQHIKTEYARTVGQAWEGKKSPERLLFETGILYGEAPLERAADDLLARFEKHALTRAYEDAVQALREAELRNDTKAIKEAEALCQKLMKELAVF